MSFAPLLRRTALAGAALLALGAAAQAQPKRLRTVPSADVTVLDPMFSTAWISLIHSVMIHASLFTPDSRRAPISSSPAREPAAACSPGVRLRYRVHRRLDPPGLSRSRQHLRRTDFNPDPLAAPEASFAGHPGLWHIAPSHPEDQADARRRHDQET